MANAIVRIILNARVERAVRLFAWAIVLRPMTTAQLREESADTLSRKMEAAEAWPRLAIDRAPRQRWIALLAERIDAIDLELQRRDAL